MTIQKGVHLQISERLHHLLDAQLQVCEVVLFSLHQLLNDLCPAVHLPRTDLLRVQSWRGRCGQVVWCHFF